MIFIMSTHSDIYLNIFFCEFELFWISSLLLDWKSKLEECERGKQEIVKKISSGMTNLDKRNRQINVKVSYDFPQAIYSIYDSWT